MVWPRTIAVERSITIPPASIRQAVLEKGGSQPEMKTLKRFLRRRPNNKTMKRFGLDQEPMEVSLPWKGRLRSYRSCTVCTAWEAVSRNHHRTIAAASNVRLHGSRQASTQILSFVVVDRIMRFENSHILTTSTDNSS